MSNDATATRAAAALRSKSSRVLPARDVLAHDHSQRIRARGEDTMRNDHQARHTDDFDFDDRSGVRLAPDTCDAPEPATLGATGEGEWVERRFFSRRVHHMVSHCMDRSWEVLPAEVIAADRTKVLRLEMLRSSGRRATRAFLSRLFEGTSAERDALRAISQVDTTIRAGDVIVVVYDPARELTSFSFPRGDELRLVGRRFMLATWRAWFANEAQPGLGHALVRRMGTACAGNGSRER